MENLETIKEETEESMMSNRSRGSNQISKSDSENLFLKGRVGGKGSVEDFGIDRSDYKNIKSPEFIDSKRQLSIKIFKSLVKVLSGVFGLAYVFADHFSFLTKIQVIEDPVKKKVSRVPKFLWHH